MFSACQALVLRKVRVGRTGMLELLFLSVLLSCPILIPGQNITSDARITPQTGLLTNVRQVLDLGPWKPGEPICSLLCLSTRGCNLMAYVWFNLVPEIFVAHSSYFCGNLRTFVYLGQTPFWSQTGAAWILAVCSGLAGAGGLWVFFLKCKVRERTAELAAANIKVSGEVEERQKAQNELRNALASERELGELKSRFVSLVSQRVSHSARDHDGCR